MRLVHVQHEKCEHPFQDRPNFVWNDRQRDYHIRQHFSLVPVTDLHGTFTILEMLPVEQAAKLAVLANQLEEQKRNKLRALRAPGRR